MEFQISLETLKGFLRYQQETKKNTNTEDS